MTPPAPLRGRRVVDLSQYIAGSVCGQLLADYGAEVVKVEPPSGDPSRALLATRFGSAYFRAFNTGKSSVTLDLRDEADQERLHELLAGADAVIMNFALRTRQRLGLDSATLHARFPRLVVTLVSGYGADDPRTCFDSIAQAVSGFAALNADEDGRPRISAGYPVDVFAGHHAAMATAMGLLDPGRADALVIDVPMIDVAMTALASPASLVAAEDGTFTPGQGNRDAATCPSNVYRCRDGHCYVYAGLDKHWERLRPLVGGAAATASHRLAAREEFDGAVEAWTARLTVDEVCARMAELGIPAGGVRDPVAALAEFPAVVGRRPDGAAVPRNPVLFSGARIARRPAPEASTTKETAR
ncbi:CaiB/BaiF CoA transferase family protein [Amycolatopsis thermophila]|uniref:Crotonobetainyl-CoA:carnitine CoA-transferase CaiB-like acyl-CoA transferase n=1 Tax=Amycolatopsis thermophila TaxID=206084 RepID=A0ABU0F1C1_9PSEU|nr:CoA transferase [Amycolatopsis thermophila]MDQ0381360.1 crotonobetainyl-CoA:carnitine CoA-transferase CaiB-like acyl-CoA transferase [Amycolatopsis thermophila]